MIIALNKQQVRLGYKILLHCWKNLDKKDPYLTEDEVKDLIILIERFMTIWHLPQPEKVALSTRRFRVAREILRERVRELSKKAKKEMRKKLRELYKEKPDIIQGF